MAAATTPVTNPVTTPTPAPTATTAATNVVAKKALDIVRKEMAKAFDLVKNGKFAEALPLLKELEVIKTMAEDVTMMIKVAEVAPAKPIDKTSIKSQLQDLYPEVVTEKITKKQKVAKWLKGQK